jgi:hypothetical protein
VEVDIAEIQRVVGNDQHHFTGLSPEKWDHGFKKRKKQ